MRNSDIAVKHIFTLDNIYKLKIEGLIYTLDDLNGSIQLTNKDIVLFAFDYYKYQYALSFFNKTHTKVISLTYMLSALMTKYFFVERFKEKIPKIIVVRTANLHRGGAFAFSKLTANEKLLDNPDFYMDVRVIEKVKDDFNHLPPQLLRKPQEELLQTLKFPKVQYATENEPQKYIDICEEYVHIKDGIRVTAESPEIYAGTIYIFGDLRSFGYGVKDDETIASYLQQILKLPYKVVNYANCLNYDYSACFDLMDKIKYEKNDIAVFVAANWQTDLYGNQYFHWFRWETIEAPIIKVDAFPLFEKRDRPDYFLHRYGYTPECNLELAKLICDSIYKNIKLFDIE